jgi:hypothetical protein
MFGSPVERVVDARLGNTSMITLRTLSEYVAAEPFRPFRIRMASGQTFDIRHPEMVLIGKVSTKIYDVVGDDKSERWRDVSMMLMESVEPMEALAQGPRN